MSSPEPKFISNWQKYNTFLKKQDNLLADIFTSYQGKKPKYEYERILSGLLHRYAMNFRSIYRTWEDFLKNSKFKFTIYTLLRPLIADYILMLYLLEEFKFKIPISGSPEEYQVIQTDFVKRYEGITGGFFERVDSNLRKKVKKGEMSPQELYEILSHHRTEFPEYFNHGTKPEVIKNQGLSPAQMVDQIVKGKQFVKDLYDYYFRLSQFEHFTVITEGLMHDVHNNWEMIHIVEVTNYLLDYLNVNLSTLRISQEFRDRTVELINGFRSTDWLINDESATASFDSKSK